MANFTTPVGNLAFVNLATPQPKGGIAGNDKVYGANLVWGKKAQQSPEFQKIKAEVDRLIEEHVKRKVPLSRIRNPLKDGGEKTYAGFGPGTIFISPTNKDRPRVVDTAKNEILDLSDVVSGMKARMNISVYSYNNASVGVGVSLNGVQVFTDEPFERLDGRPSVDAMFGDDGEDVF
jgi:hypothetical protein